MLSKCANPSCSTKFRYLGEGRIFSLLPGSESAEFRMLLDHPAVGQVERYWLCDVCARNMTLCRVQGHIVVRRLPGRALPAESETTRFS
jgi:hypothetical protein